MTVGEVITKVDRYKPNAFSEEEKTEWISRCEGMVQTQIFLFAKVEIITYSWPESKDVSLLVDPPFDKLYASYLEAMIDYHNGEYDKYQNTMQMFNSDFSELMNWFANAYRPADTWERA